MSMSSDAQSRLSLDNLKLPRIPKTPRFVIKEIQEGTHDGLAVPTHCFLSRLFKARLMPKRSAQWSNSVDLHRCRVGLSAIEASSAWWETACCSIKLTSWLPRRPLHQRPLHVLLHELGMPQTRSRIQWVWCTCYCKYHVMLKRKNCCPRSKNMKK